MKNDGVSTGGGDITGGQFAVGVSGGHVEQHASSPSPPDDRLEALLDRVEALLTEHAPRLPEGDLAMDDLADVREQAARPAPDRRRLADALRRLTERVASVGALITAVKAVARSLGLP